ncbi:MAG: tyrosine-protein kinase family protein [Gammaproteobacteria bacterium]|nr:tyrosine-protein kinase family protein [Gammaproteobacteria bacterium]
MSTIEKAIEKLNQGAASPVSRPNDVPLSAANVAAGVVESAQSSASQSGRVMLNLGRMERSGYLTPETGRTQLAEEMRHIKRPLLLNAFARGAAQIKNGNLIMVTSSRPGEGKSFTSLNLAMSIAKERDKTVLLVDSDVAKPSISRILGIETGAGLVDYLLDESMDLPEVMLRTNVPNLRLLPAGRRHIHSTELLASEAMQRLTEELSQRYPDRVVIFDSPPLLATTEASVLAQWVGQVVMVVESEKTTKQELNESLSLLGDDEKVVGLVLNKSRASLGTDYYGYYGSYGE